MRQILKLFVVLIGAILLSACKIAVIVAEGGLVDISAGIGGIGVQQRCHSGNICIFEVEGKFPHRFDAYSYDGWIFDHWQDGDRFLCGGSRESTCTVSFRGIDDETAEKILESSATMYVMPIFRPPPDTVLVDGKEWFQPYLFEGLSWNDINAICPDGVCTGFLHGQDMTGWTWASVKDMNDLFNHYLGSELLGPGPDEVLGSYPSAESVADMFEDKWLPTSFDNNSAGYGYWREISGWTKNGLNTEQDKAWHARWRDWGSVELDIITDGVLGKDFKNQSIGAWFFRIP